MALYIADYEGYIFEDSAEEELILDDEAYEAQVWPIMDPHAADEWTRQPPPERMK